MDIEKIINGIRSKRESRTDGKMFRADNAYDEWLEKQEQLLEDEEQERAFAQWKDKDGNKPRSAKSVEEVQRMWEIYKGVRSDEWVTMHGAHVEIGEDGELKGTVGDAIRSRQPKAELYNKEAVKNAIKSGLDSMEKKLVDSVRSMTKDKYKDAIKTIDDCTSDEKQTYNSLKNNLSLVEEYAELASKADSKTLTPYDVRNSTGKERFTDDPKENLAIVKDHMDSVINSYKSSAEEYKDDGYGLEAEMENACANVCQDVAKVLF